MRTLEPAPRQIACGAMLMLVLTGSAAAGCNPAPQGDARVAAVVDARSLRLQDGREIRLTGIEPSPDGAAVLGALVAGREVTLRGDSDAPDRYGRQSAFVFLEEPGRSVQSELLIRGAAAVDGSLMDPSCLAELLAAEAAARTAKRGVWSGSDGVKPADNTDEIWASLDRFAVVEGKVLSVREAGSTHYINFGRRWTRDFAVTISRRVVASLATVGIVPKSLERRRIRVRGWIEGRDGPRIEVRSAGQIEVLDN